MHTDAISFELEWLGEGLKNSTSLTGVRYWYDKNNKIMNISKIIGKPIVAVGDKIGTLRLFSYPNKHGEGYF